MKMINMLRILDALIAVWRRRVGQGGGGRVDKVGKGCGNKWEGGAGGERISGVVENAERACVRPPQNQCKANAEQMQSQREANAKPTRSQCEANQREANKRKADAEPTRSQRKAIVSQRPKHQL